MPLFEGVVIVLAGAAMMALLEGEKWLLRRLDVFDELKLDANAATAGATP